MTTDPTTLKTDVAAGEAALLAASAAIAALDPALAGPIAILDAVAKAIEPEIPAAILLAEQWIAILKGQSTDNSPIAPQIQADTAPVLKELDTPIGGQS